MPIVASFGGLAAFGWGSFPGGDFESIATVTVGSGGASSIEFTSIPGTYQHLQVRWVTRSTRTGNSLDSAHVRLNGDTGSNYARHQINGDGSSASAAGVASQTTAQVLLTTASNATANNFGAGIFDILDYADTSKNSTIRSFCGYDNNGSGVVTLRSGLWTSTSAVTAVALFPNVGPNFAEYSTAALFGLRAP